VGFFRRLFKHTVEDDPEKIIAKQIDNWLKLNSSFIGSVTDVDEVKKSLPLTIILNIIADNIMKCNENGSVFSQYISIPEYSYSMNLTLCPFTFEQAKRHFYSLYPDDGFFQYMEKVISTATAADLDKNNPHKSGVIFVLICICPAGEKTYIYTTLGIYPFKISRNKIVIF